MDYLVIGLFAIFSMLWRPWLGGLWRRYTALSTTWLKYSAAIAAAGGVGLYFGFTALQSLAFGGVYIWYWRIMGHGWMLLLGDPRDELKWMLKSQLRYGLIAYAAAGTAMWAVYGMRPDFPDDSAILLATAPTIIAGILIPFVYRYFMWLDHRYYAGKPRPRPGVNLYRPLLAIGGVSFGEAWKARIDGLSLPPDHPFAEHNELPHHYSEIVAGLLFGIGYATTISLL